jgi:AraC-like DNA-binding protein
VLLAVLFRAVLDPALPVPCFVACAKALRHALTTDQTESALATAEFAENLVMEALEYYPTDPRVTTVIERLKAAVSACRHPTEDEIAQRLSVHPSHVGRMLKAETGLSFRSWRSGLVSEDPGGPPGGTNEQVAQIAYRFLGYEHPSQLDREFHETFGFSPREFRRMA